MRRRFALALLLLLTSPGAIAANDGPRPLGAGETLRGRFSQERHLTGFDKPLRTEGSFVLAMDRGLLWRSERPIVSTMAIGPKGVLQTVGGQEAMRISTSQAPALAHFFETLRAALSGDLRNLEAGYTVDRSVGAERWRVVLRPKDGAGPPVVSITLAGAGLLERVDIEKAEGDRESLRFFDQSFAPAALTAEESALLDAVAR